MSNFTESIVEEAALAWLESLGYAVLHGPDIADNSPTAIPIREKALDVAIDTQYGIVEVGEQNYYASELLFAVDYNAYRDLGGRLSAPETDSNPETDGEVSS